MNLTQLDLASRIGQRIAPVRSQLDEGPWLTVHRITLELVGGSYVTVGSSTSVDYCTCRYSVGGASLARDVMHESDICDTVADFRDRVHAGGLEPPTGGSL